MKKTSKIAALFVAAALTVALATGCSQQQNEQSSGSNQSASSAAVDSLTIAISADENTLTPFTYVHGSPGFDAMSLIYDTLFVRTPDNTIIPWMVKEYSVENDSKVYHITLEDGLKWHDGQPLTAPRQMTASYFPLFAIFFAAKGSSYAPGTQARSMSLPFTP